MSYKVAIRKNETGEVRIYDMAELDWDEHSIFWWTEGNFGCDCNRGTSFLRAGGPGPADDPHWNEVDFDCGEVAYSVLYAELPDGKRIEIDDQPDRVPEKEPCIKCGKIIDVGPQSQHQCTAANSGART